jgi:hypothetical protein
MPDKKVIDLQLNHREQERFIRNLESYRELLSKLIEAIRTNDNEQIFVNVLTLVLMGSPLKELVEVVEGAAKKAVEEAKEFPDYIPGFPNS